MREYMIKPEGYSPDNIPRGKLVELHTVGPKEENADIAILEDGIVPEHIPPIMYREKLADKLGAELPPVKVAKQIHDETRTKLLGKKKGPDLRKGMPPLPQLIIVDELGWERETSVKEIVGDIEDLGWYESVDEVDVGSDVKECLDYLADEDRNLVYYDKKREVCHLTPRSSDRKSFAEYMNLENRGYDIKEGPYPVVRLIRDTVSRGSLKKREILKKVHRDWKWTRSRGAGKFWINTSIELGYIKETVGNRYEPHRTL